MNRIKLIFHLLSRVLDTKRCGRELDAALQQFVTWIQVYVAWIQIVLFSSEQQCIVVTECTDSQSPRYFTWSTFTTLL
jgi:hypothetical protein